LEKIESYTKRVEQTDKIKIAEGATQWMLALKKL
jgi:hypothetical protein